MTFKSLKQFIHRRYKKSALGNNRGVALMLAIACVVFIMYMVNEVSFETNVEYIVYSQSVNRLKSYYAARSGVELSLLRIKMYSQIYNQFGKQLGPQARALDMIWSLPMAWPPIFPEDLSAVDKDLINKVTKESTLDAQYLATIEDEGSKIDVNDLVSPSKVLQEMAHNQLANFFQNKMRNDEDWARDHRDFRPDELVNNIADWMSDKRSSFNGGDKESMYRDLGAGFPPNRGFRTVGEIRLVEGMTDEYYALIEPHVTVYGMKGLNPNTAPGDVLMSIDPSITKEIVKVVLERRDDPNKGGPFQNAEDFWSFLAANGAQLAADIEKKIPLVFNDVLSFKIKSTGSFGNTTAEITAVVYDIDKITTRVADYVKKEKQEQNPQAPGAGQNPPPNDGSGSGGAPRPPETPEQQQAKAAASKGPPRIVYWNER